MSQPTVLVLWFSQTGQMTECVDALTYPMEAHGWNVQKQEITPIVKYPFPWPVTKFFGIFPSAADDSSEIYQIGPENSHHDVDLVIFAYQVWYLQPSIPMRSFIHHNPQIFSNHNVVSLIASRNMWYSAAISVANRLRSLGANYLGTIAVIDTSPPAMTFVTTLRWLLLGKRQSLGPLRRAGVGQDELDRLSELGGDLAIASTTQDKMAGNMSFVKTVTQVLENRVSAPTDYPIAAADIIAGHIFQRVSKRVNGTQSPLLRKLALAAFVPSLATAIVFGLPALTLGNLILHTIFRTRVDTALWPIHGYCEDSNVTDEKIDSL